jgi:hypothetical protein
MSFMTPVHFSFFNPNTHPFNPDKTLLYNSKNAYFQIVALIIMLRKGQVKINKKGFLIQIRPLLLPQKNHWVKNLHLVENSEFTQN